MNHHHDILDRSIASPILLSLPKRPPTTSQKQRAFKMRSCHRPPRSTIHILLWNLLGMHWEPSLCLYNRLTPGAALSTSSEWWRMSFIDLPPICWMFASDLLDLPIQTHLDLFFYDCPPNIYILRLSCHSRLTLRDRLKEWILPFTSMILQFSPPIKKTRV